MSTTANSNNNSTGPSPSTAATTTATTSSNSGGISIEEAISILSFRAKKKHSNSKLNHNESLSTTTTTTTTTTSSNGNCNDNSNESQVLKEMGQTIDLMSSQEWTRLSERECTDNDTTAAAAVDSSMMEQERQAMYNENQHQQQQQQKQEQQELLQNKKLKESFNNQSPKELLETLFHLQQERVLAYQKFNHGLDVVLKSGGNFTDYPKLATDVTAIFVVISNSILEIQTLLLKKKTTKTTSMKKISEFIKQLQMHEKEKLQLTAALHLEKMRECNEHLEKSISNSNNDSVDTGSSSSSSSSSSNNTKVAQLLQESISSLESKLVDCVENINDVLEELRYEAADMDDS